MKSSNLINILKQGNLVMPLYLYQNYSKLNLKLDEFMVLIYLYNKNNNFVFNPQEISDDLNIDLSKVMNYISVLTDKNLIDVKVQKNDKGIMEEYINMDLFYQKVSLLLSEDINSEKKSSNSNIFEIIEKEFGRTLSPMEYEIIKAWLDNNISEELINEALKEATFNGVSNLRYIDKILYEWGKSGIKTKNDVEKRRKSHKKEKDDVDLDLFDYDWFDDDE